MSLGSWDPKTQQVEGEFKIEREPLLRFIAISRNEQLHQLEQELSASEQQIQASLMQQNRDSWFAAAADFSDEQLVDLIRFFTLAEKLPGWEAGDKSPVIWITKVLKQRGKGIERELLLWIKEHSSNRFIPHGSL